MESFAESFAGRGIPLTQSATPRTGAGDLRRKDEDERKRLGAK